MKDPDAAGDDESGAGTASTDYVGPRGGRGKKDLATGRVKYTKHYEAEDLVERYAAYPSLWGEILQKLRILGPAAPRELAESLLALLAKYPDMRKQLDLKDLALLKVLQSAQMQSVLDIQ